MLTRHINLRSLQYVSKMRFGGHHARPYDWRDDPSVNTSYEQDPRSIGIKDPMDYSFPHKAKGRDWILSAPEDYDPKDISQNVGRHSHVGAINNLMAPPETDWMADIAHEKDYESEDLDYQPESFETQHFRKKGPIWMWVLVGFMPILFFGNEMILQGWSDEDAWRKTKTAPLHYPDQEDSPDLEDFMVFRTAEYNNWYNAGIVNKPYFYCVI
jgi:hypothetical protein